VVCTGTLHEVKGQTFLLEACRILAERGVGFVCSFVGDGPDRRALEEQARQAGIQDRVRFLGRLTRAQITRLLAGADALAAPSVPSRDGRREGIPVAIMEGMASGLPVVASRLSGIPELVEDGKQGLLVEPGDARALAEALLRLERSPRLRHQLGREGRVRVQNEFDLHGCALALARRFGDGR
jgi:glycosyltransferase involved in cell wall biosynthesis